MNPKAWLTHDWKHFNTIYLNHLTNCHKRKPCGYFDSTKYSDGILPIDTYKKDVDELANKLNYDWEELEYGLRHSTCLHRCHQNLQLFQMLL